MTTRRGATRRADIPDDVLRGLNRGELESATLSEGLAVDFAQLLRHACAELAEAQFARVEAAASQGITARMQLLGGLLLDSCGLEAAARFSRHPSDTVRGWAAYVVGAAPGLTLEQRLALVRPLADDAHFGVREWAWLSLRPHVAHEPLAALASLRSWALSPSARVRRFASEATRPRGVWCAHIELFKREPHHALDLLEALHADDSRYVQDSVANWLNDAGRSRPDWVVGLCEAWRARDPAASAYVRRRALRSLKG